MTGSDDYGPYEYDFTVVRTDIRNPDSKAEKTLSTDAPTLIMALRRLADELEDGWGSGEDVTIRTPFRMS